MTRVLHVTRDLAPASVGGLSTAVAGMVAASVGAGVEVTVLSFDRWRPRAGAPAPAAAPLDASRASGARVLRLTDEAQLSAARAAAIAARPDVVHVHDAFLWPWAHEVAVAVGAGTLYTAHVLHAAQDRLRGLDTPTRSAALEATAIARATVLAAPSGWVFDHLAATAGDPGRVSLTPLGVSDSAARQAARAAARAADAPVLYVGRFADVKGTDRLPTLAARMTDDLPGVRLVVAGGVPANPRGDRRWRRRLGGAPNIDLSGWLDGDALVAAFAAASVVVCPSRIETFGQVAVEAMLCGAPVCGTAIPAFTALAGDPSDPLMVLTPVDDDEALARSVVSLHGDPERARRLAGRAAAAARDACTWDDAVGPLLAAYARVMNRS